MEPKPVVQQVPSLGRIVHFILMPSGEHRAAIVVAVAEGEPTPETPVQLHVFRQPGDLVPKIVPWVVQGIEPGSWHWPEYVPAK